MSRTHFTQGKNTHTKNRKLAFLNDVSRNKNHFTQEIRKYWTGMEKDRESFVMKTYSFKTLKTAK